MSERTKAITTGGLDPVHAAKAARLASARTAALPTGVKNAVLMDLADRIESRSADVLEANARDLDAARAAGLSGPKVQRLALTPASVGHLAAGLRAVAALPDPVGQVTRKERVPSGLEVRKVRAPLGVICMIYEARPGVTVDAFALCFKAGNACILKGGKEAEHSNARLAELARESLAAHDAPVDSVCVVSAASRDQLRELLTLDRYIDLVIPRGGPELIRFVHEHSTIPTVQHFHGVCHVYVDKDADLDKALKICVTAKTSAPATCNAAECVLVHKNVADRFVPELAAAYASAGVEVRGTPLVQALAPTVKPAAPDDFGREFLDLVVAVRIVQSIDEAIEHIATYGSSHTEAIVSEDAAAADRFTALVQSSCVLVNASTRFNDGFQLGLGAEIGISTSRVHAYGPMGLEELTTQRYIVRGDGQTR
jgi:glutamate-5-semialdehyde dehydrogenase